MPFTPTPQAPTTPPPGWAALFSNTTGANNTASGSGALFSNTTASDNTAIGFGTLYDNFSGASNTATGFQALLNNSTASNNTATGANALATNTTGGSNTATGAQALQKSTIGAGNTALGAGALSANTTGSNNVAVGNHAGQSLTTGSNNIDIGNMGVAAESNKIRIGTHGTQTGTFIAGIYNIGVTTGGPEAVVVNNLGQLGMVPSSARYKRDIRDMGQASEALMNLRPVTFRYKQDPAGTLQYGLVAEEVAHLYPELVGYGDDGQPRTVRYLELSAMLLNELQKQSRKNQLQGEQLAKLKAQMAEEKTESERRIAGLSAQVNEEKSSHKREIETLRNSFAQRLTALERVMARNDGKLAAAFGR